MKGDVGAPDLVLRPLTRDDFGLLVRWLARAHVAEWWGPPLDRPGVEEKYGPSVDGTDPTLLFICTEDTVDVGFVQIYRMADNPDYARAVGNDDGAGIDILIGDAARCGQGLGPRMIRAAAELAWARYPEVQGALAGPSVRNTRSLQAFATAGFRALRQVTVEGEEDNEMIMFLPRPRPRPRPHPPAATAM